jgi:hypothetical protein
MCNGAGSHPDANQLTGACRGPSGVGRRRAGLRAERRGPGWGKVMAAAVLLSVVATTGVGIVLTARIMNGIAS